MYFALALVFLNLSYEVCFIEACHGIRIINRRGWGARPPKSRDPTIPPVKHCFIHHSDTPPCHNQQACTQRVKSMQNHHMDTNKWSDIGYTFMIGGDGNVYEGTGWGIEGAHTLHHNRDGIGIVFIGNFQGKPPTPGMLTACQRLIECGVKLGKIQRNYALHGHRDSFQTSCPGNALYGIIQKWPHYRRNI